MEDPTKKLTRDGVMKYFNHLASISHAAFWLKNVANDMDFSDEEIDILNKAEEWADKQVVKFSFSYNNDDTEAT